MNINQPCPHCNKIPPRNFEDFDTCYGAYEFEGKEYRVDVLGEVPEEPTLTYEGFKCQGQARDWVNYFYSGRDWNLGRVA